MDMHPVKSSNVDAVGYDPASRKMHIRFKNGGTYCYHDVPQDKHAALIAAPSVGSFVHQNIRGIHKHSKVEAA